MIKTVKAGVIGCDMSEDFFMDANNRNAENIQFKKVYAGDKLKNSIGGRYAHAEIVNDIDAIVNDAEITLVIVSEDNLPLVKPVIEAGKSVRII